MKTMYGAVFLGILFAAVTSCAYINSSKYRSYPKNPFPDIETVAVFPFYNETTSVLDIAEVSNIFSDELAKFPGFTVIRPVKVVMGANAAGINPTTLADVIRLGKTLKADAVLVVTVTSYDPYRPPKIALSMQLYRTSEAHLSAGEIDRIVQSATWKPFKVTKGNASNLVASFERVYDSHKHDVRAEVEAYGMAQDDRDYAYTGGEEFLSITNRYWQFVSCQMIREMFEKSNERESH